MKHLVIAFSILVLAGATVGCSSERRSSTTTRTVESVPADPVMIEKRTSTTETRTSE